MKAMILAAVLMTTTIGTKVRCQDTGDPEKTQIDLLTLKCAQDPLQSAIIIRFCVEQSDNVILNVYDARGTLVATILDEFCLPGPQELQWNCRDASYNLLRPGVYYLSLVNGGSHSTTRILLSH